MFKPCGRFGMGVLALVVIVLWLLLVHELRAETCNASWYGHESGRRMADGEAFRPMSTLVAAHRSYPFGTRLQVSYRGRAVNVIVKDRGPAVWTGRCLDLSALAAKQLGIYGRGVALVNIQAY